MSKISFDCRVSGSIAMYIDDVLVHPTRSQKVFNHSPDGFQVGYHGSGPAQTALAIMLCFTDRETALRLYQDFKREFVAEWDENGTYEVDVDEWIKVKQLGF